MCDIIRSANFKGPQMLQASSATGSVGGSGSGVPSGGKGSYSGKQSGKGKEKDDDEGQDDSQEDHPDDDNHDPNPSTPISLTKNAIITHTTVLHLKDRHDAFRVSITSSVRVHLEPPHVVHE